VPGAMDTAVLGGVGPYVVSVNATTTVGGAMLPNPEAVLLVSPSRNLTVGDSAGTGTILVNNGMSTATSTLFIADDAVFDSVVRLNDGSGTSDAEIRTTSGASVPLMLGENGRITGQGRIRSPIVGGTIRGGAGELDIFVQITDALIEAGPDAIFNTNASTVISSSTIRGLWQIQPGQSITLGTNVVVEDGILVNNGMSTATSTLFIADDAVFDSVVRLNDGSGTSDAEIRTTSGASVPLMLGENGRITGQGRIRSPIAGGGTLAPGVGPDGVGLLVPSGFDLSENARIEIDAAGTAPSEYDRLDGSGAVTLDGSLDVNFVEGYVPDPKDQYEIISATTVDGFFRQTTIEPVGDIGPAHVVYTGDSVIVVICAADRDADGELTIFDFLAFQNLFDSGDLRADLDQDGQLTIFDFLTYQNRFDAGCG
ncbi:MAG: GC-type dockerin domain-anchored protein, partial [Phycisphaerales bacterium JB060]